MPINKGKTAICPKCGNTAYAVFTLTESDNHGYTIFVCPECQVKERQKSIMAYAQKMRRAKTEKGKNAIFARFIADGTYSHFGEFPVRF